MARVYKFLLAGFFCVPLWVQAELVVTLRSPTTSLDKHKDYSNELVRLALEKTQAHYGGFRIKYMPASNYVRSLKAMVDNAYSNLVVETSYEQSLSTKVNLTFINFPIDLGVAGYRVCFIDPKLKASGKRFSSLEDLKPYTFVHGIAWADTEILRHNGLRVREVENHDSMFLMIVAGRADFFCRGANEILGEKYQFSELTNLVTDDSFMLVYPQPKFLYLNSKNEVAKERIERGLRLAYADGSLQKVWLKQYGASVNSVKLGDRQAIVLENPLVQGLDIKIKTDFLHLLLGANKASRAAALPKASSAGNANVSPASH